MNACALITERVRAIRQPSQTAFGEWFKRIKGQRSGTESALAADCLSFLDLTGAVLDICDFYNSSWRSSKLRAVKANFATYGSAYLTNADLREAQLSRAQFQGAGLEGANFEGANLQEVNFRHARLKRASFKNAVIEGARFEDANIDKAQLEGVIPVKKVAKR